MANFTTIEITEGRSVWIFSRIMGLTGIFAPPPTGTMADSSQPSWMAKFMLIAAPRECPTSTGPLRPRAPIVFFTHST